MARDWRKPQAAKPHLDGWIPTIRVLDRDGQDLRSAMLWKLFGQYQARALRSIFPWVSPYHGPQV